MIEIGIVFNMYLNTRIGYFRSVQLVPPKNEILKIEF